MKDIARDLGISAMAVSKALRGHSDIGEETRARVQQRAAELGYRVDHVARSMVTGRTFLVGLIVPDLMQSFFAEIANALAAELAPAGYHVVMANSAEQASTEIEDIDVFVSRRVDGMVIASAQHDAERLAGLRMPLVLVDRQVPGLDASMVGSDDVAIGRLATRHLIEQGCRRIVHLAGPASSAAEGRREGFLAELRDARLRSYDVIETGHDDSAGEAAMQRLLEGHDRPDGVFAFNDPVAIGAMRAILAAGLNIPDEIAVIGAARIHHGDMLRVPLSTIDQDTAAIGRECARLLIEAMSSPPETRTSQRIVVPIKLVARESSLRR